MERNIRDLLSLYNPNDPLDHAWTIPSPWYFDSGIHELEQRSVFAKTWQVVGRADQVKDKGCFFTADLAGEPIVVARGDEDRKSTRLNSSHSQISYAVFCLKK